MHPGTRVRLHVAHGVHQRDLTADSFVGDGIDARQRGSCGSLLGRQDISRLLCLVLLVRELLPGSFDLGWRHEPDERQRLDKI